MEFRHGNPIPNVIAKRRVQIKIRSSALAIRKKKKKKQMPRSVPGFWVETNAVGSILPLVDCCFLVQFRTCIFEAPMFLIRKSNECQYFAQMAILH